MKLSWKFIGTVLVVLVIMGSARAWWLAQEMRQRILSDAEQSAFTVLSFGEACRQYAREVLSPAVRPHAKTLIFEADSATFVARGTFQFFRQRMPAYSFREAALNPLNPENQADGAEKELIRRFSSNPGLKELSGFRTTEAGELFYVARPIVVQKVCLDCHASPQSAPPELVARYGDHSGYGWKEGEISSAIIITVPAKDIHGEQQAVFWPLAVTYAVSGILLAGLIWCLFHFLVSRRLGRVARLMEEVAASPATDTRLHDRAADELGHLARSFDRMADGLKQSHLLLEQRVLQRTNELAGANDALARSNSELRQKSQELEQFNTLAVGREQRMIELKRQVNALARAAGQQPPYDLSFTEDERESARP